MEMENNFTVDHDMGKTVPYYTKQEPQCCCDMPFLPKGSITSIENDTVNHPSHYTHGSIECIDAIKSATTDLDGIEAVLTGNALKYIWRWKWKNGVEDLRKAIFYINRLIEEVENNGRTET